MPSIVQTKAQTDGTGFGWTLNLTQAVTAGNSVFLFLAEGNTPTATGETFTNSGLSIGIGILWCVQSSVGGYSSISVPNADNAYFIETHGSFSSIGSSSDTSGTSGTIDSGSIAVSGGSLVLGLGDANTGTWTGPASGWTNMSAFRNSNNSVSSILSYQASASAGNESYAPSSTNGVTNGAVSAIIAFNFALTVSLSVGQLNLSGPIPQPPVILPVGQLDLASYAVTEEWGISLPVGQLDLAGPAIQPRIELTLLCALAAAAGTDDSGSTYAQGFTGVTTAFQPLTAPVLVETVHNMPAMSNSWAAGSGGQAKYRINSNQCLEFSFVLRTIGTLTDATVLWAAGSLPAGYQVPVAKYWPVVLIGTYAVSGNTPSLLFGTDGSIAIYGISGSTVTGIDAHGVLPLEL